MHTGVQPLSDLRRMQGLSRSVPYALQPALDAELNECKKKALLNKQWVGYTSSDYIQE